MPPLTISEASPVTTRFPEGPRFDHAPLSVSFYEGGIVRLCSGKTTSLSEATGLMNFGDATPAIWREEGPWWVTESGGTRLSVHQFRDAFRCEGEGWAVETAGEGRATPFQVALALGNDEAVFGFGFQRKAIDCRRLKLSWRRSYRSGSATVPFFFTSAGYGIFSNNSWAHEFDCGATQPDQLELRADGGAMDLFVLPGPTPRTILDNYTRLCGRPQLPPKWALGLHYIARYFETQEGLLQIAERFRETGIPCDMLGLEPGWEKNPYSMTWVWCPERFPDPATMIRELAERGFRFGLWESGEAPMSDYLDPVVRRDWYARRAPVSVDLGVAFFKQDDPYPRMIKSTEMNEAEFKGSLGVSQGHSAAEAGELSNALFAQTSQEEFERRTGGQRALTLFCGYMTGPAAHRWPVVWAADFPNGSGMLSAGLSGHSMAAIDMKAEGAAGIHFGYLTPYSLIDSWAFYQDPWLLPPHLFRMHRLYGRLRSRLRPYLYSTVWQSSLSGVPMMRAMALEHPHDPDLRNLTTQHYLGDWFLVGQAGSADGASDDERFVQQDAPWRVRLPPGKWFDYWRGTPVEVSDDWYEFPAKASVGGPLLVKAGAIIPMGSCEPHENQATARFLRLDIFPDSSASQATIYDDDGLAHPMERGAWTRCSVACLSTENEVRVAVSRFEGGQFRGPARAWLLSLHLERTPESVRLGGAPLSLAASIEELFETNCGPAFFWDCNTGICWVRVQKGWSLRQIGDPEESGYDSFKWEGEGEIGPLARGGFEVTIPLGNGWACGSTATPALVEPDRLHLIANPPERVALEGGGWLPMKTTLWATLLQGEKVSFKPGVEVRFVARQEERIVCEATAATDFNGCAVVAGWDYEPGVTEFEAVAPGLPAAKVVVGKAPVIRGGLR